MKVITHTIETTEDITLLPLADLHIGDAHCDRKLILETVDKILKTPNCFTVIDGDFINNAIANSRSDFYGETMPPQEQLKRCLEIFKPLADAGKILAVLPGNHEERSYRATGTAWAELFALQLGIGDVYSPTSALLFLRFGHNSRQRKNSYTVYVNHGNSGGRKISGKLGRLEDLGQTVIADVYVVGHSHAPATFRKQIVIPNHQNGTISLREQVFVNTASFLDWNGSYGDRMGLPPTSKKLPMIRLSATDHEIEVTL